MWPFKISNKWYKFESFSALTAEIYPDFYHPSVTFHVYKLLLFFLSKKSGWWIQNRFSEGLRKYCKMSTASSSQYVCILFSLFSEPLSFGGPVFYSVGYLFKICLCFDKHLLTTCQTSIPQDAHWWTMSHVSAPYLQPNIRLCFGVVNIIFGSANNSNRISCNKVWE